MQEPGAGHDEQIRAETWQALYEFFLAEHERHLESVTALGVSPGDLKALVRMQPDRRESMRALADTWRCDASTVTWIVDRLEKKGYVERQTHPTDRRVKVVVLSASGTQVRTRYLDRIYQPPAALAELSRADLDVLRRLAARLTPGEPDPAS